MFPAVASGDMPKPRNCGVIEPISRLSPGLNVGDAGVAANDEDVDAEVDVTGAVASQADSRAGADACAETVPFALGLGDTRREAGRGLEVGLLDGGVSASTAWPLFGSASSIEFRLTRATSSRIAECKFSIRRGRNERCASALAARRCAKMACRPCGIYRGTIAAGGGGGTSTNHSLRAVRPRLETDIVASFGKSTIMPVSVTSIKSSLPSETCGIRPHNAHGAQRWSLKTSEAYKSEKMAENGRFRRPCDCICASVNFARRIVTISCKLDWCCGRAPRPPLAGRE